MLLVHFIRETARPDRHPLGLRHVQLRRLRGADGRPAGQVVHHPRRHVRRARDPHRRVARGRRPARPDPAGLPRDARAAVRLLHARDADDDAGAAGREPRSDRSRDPHRDLGRDLPLHRVQEHRQRRALGRRARGRGQTRGREHGHHREPPEPHHRAPDRLRPAEAQGGRALHPRPGQLPGRHQAAGHGATARCCAARTRTRRSSRSTRRRRSRTRTSRRSSPPRTSRRSAWRGCRRSPTTPRPCWRATRCASRARRSRS